MNPEIEKHDIVGNGILIHKKHRVIRTNIYIYMVVLYKKIQKQKKNTWMLFIQSRPLVVVLVLAGRFTFSSGEFEIYFSVKSFGVKRLVVIEKHFKMVPSSIKVMNFILFLHYKF